MDALLSGNRTSLIQFNGIRPNGLSEAVTINAKLSLQKNGNGYDLKMHPVNLQPKNDLELSQKEMEFLKKDPLNLLPKMVVGSDGKLVDSFVSFDRMTNEFVPVKRDKIRSPEAINDIFLSDAQKKDFANGKPIQLGNEQYRMDVNSENGVDGKKIEKVRFKTGEYSAYNFLLDAALVVSGLGILVMVEHLAKMAFNNREAVHGLLSQDLKPAIKRTVSNITEKANHGVQLSNREKNELLVINVKDTMAERQQQKRTRPQKQEISKPELVAPKPVVQKETALPQEQKTESKEEPSFTYSGKLLEHGPAPYEFNKENKGNYFVKLGTDAGEKLVWGVDLERAVQQGGANIGELIGINHEGVKPVKVNVDLKDKNGTVIGTEEKTIDRNNWDVKVLDRENKQGQSQKTEAPIVDIPEVVTEKIGQKDKTDPEDIIVVRFDPTADLEKQQAEIGRQVSEQLYKYDGKGLVLVGRVTELPVSEASNKGAEQLERTEKLQVYINEEVHRQIKAVRIVSYDEVKIIHPEQRQTGETKPVLENDRNKQANKAAVSSDAIKKDAKEIQQVRKGPKR